MSYFSQAFNYISHYFTAPPQGLPDGSTPLALTAEQGYGYFPAIPGQSLKDGHYKVSHMLGIGQSSSVFMVHDQLEDGLVLSAQLGHLFRFDSHLC